MNEAWRELKVGDQVRIVRLPAEMVTYSTELVKELEPVYRKLIDTGMALTIDQVDEYGTPWISWEEGEGEGWISESLALNDDSWERWSDDEK